MIKTTIKSKVYMGFIFLVALSILLFGAVSWFARGYVLDGAKKIRYNSSLARKNENVRALSDEKITLLYKAVLDKKDVTAEITKIDDEINTACNAILSDLSTFESGSNGGAAGEARGLITAVLEKEKAVTDAYNSFILPTITGSNEEKLKADLQNAMTSWDSLSQSLEAYSQKNTEKMISELKALDENLLKHGSSVESVLGESRQGLDMTQELHRAVTNYLTKTEAFMKKSQAELDEMTGLLMSAAQATTLPAITAETLPVYDYSEQKESLAKDSEALLSLINDLVKMNEDLSSKISGLDEALGGISFVSFQKALDQREAIIKAQILTLEIQSGGAVAVLEGNLTEFEALNTTKVTELRAVLEGFMSQDNAGMTQMDSAASAFNEAVVSLKAMASDKKAEGLNRIQTIKSEMLPQFQSLSQILQTHFEENVTASQNIETFIIPAIIALAVASLLAGILMAFIVSTSIIKPIRQMTGLLKKAEQGDLKSRIDTPMASEFSQMAISVNKVLDTREQILDETVAVSESISLMRSLLSGSFTQNKELLKNMAQGMEELLRSFRSKPVALKDTEVLESVELDVAVTQEAMDVTERSKQTAQEAKEAIMKASVTVKDIAQQIEQLEGSSGKIEEITNTITQIAKRTNLLALNAAIEAAKAGEQGRGFAVLADEIRKLADASGNAAKAIKTQLSEIQERIQLTVQNMDEGVSGVEQGARGISDVHQSIEDITERVRQVVGTLDDYAQKSNKQLVANQQLMETISTMNQTTTELYETGQSMDMKLKDSKMNITEMERIENMLNSTYSRLNGILDRYKGKS